MDRIEHREKGGLGTFDLASVRPGGFWGSQGSGVTEWPNTPNEEAWVSGQFNNLKWPDMG